MAWADQNLSQQSVDNSLMDVSTSTFTNTQMALFDNFVSHASPVRKVQDIQAGMKSDRDLSPSPCVPSATIGILTNSVSQGRHVAHCPQGSPERKPQGSPERKTTASPTPPSETPVGKNGYSGTPTIQLSTKPGTPLFVTTPRTAFTPRNYLKFHPLSENRSHQNGLTFTPRFQNRPENLAANPTETPTGRRKNGFSSPSVEFNPTFSAKAAVPPYLSPKPAVVDSSARPMPKPAFLPLAAVSKPRAPTPIDEGSWSSSQSSSYSAKLNAVLNRKGYFEPERRNAVKRGQSLLDSPKPDSSSSAPSGNGIRHLPPGKRAEPYVLPRPHQYGDSRPDSRTSDHHINTPMKASHHLPVSRTTSFNAFEDNFVSPARVKTPLGAAASALGNTRSRTPVDPTVAKALHYPTSPAHSPSPPSSSVR